MVNYKIFRINDRKIYGSASNGHITFELDNKVDFKDWTYGEISFVNRHPCNSFQVGNYVEIDLDYTRTELSNQILGNVDAIRKVSSSSSTNIITTRGSSSDIVISSGAVSAMNSPNAMSLARRMSEMVDATGKEYEFKIEDPSSKLNYSLICRK